MSTHRYDNDIHTTYTHIRHQQPFVTTTPTSTHLPHRYRMIHIRLLLLFTFCTHSTTLYILRVSYTMTHQFMNNSINYIDNSIVTLYFTHDMSRLFEVPLLPATTVLRYTLSNVTHHFHTRYSTPYYTLPPDQIRCRVPLRLPHNVAYRQRRTTTYS